MGRPAQTEWRWCLTCM